MEGVSITHDALPIFGELWKGCDGGWRWYIIGCYLAPDDARTIERVVTALGGSTARHRPTSGGGLQYRFWGYGKRREGSGDCGGTDGGGGRRHDGALPPEEATMVKGTPELEYGEGGKGDKVSDGLPPGD